MNPMLQALETSRANNPVSSSGPMPGGPPAAQAPAVDPAKMMGMLTEMSGKIDKILEALSSAYRGKEPEAPQNDGNEAQETK